ncbi:hypothetical protein CEXT_517041 [Caerostris extrusa]|uniref:Uncharacterized protein n=1 Tax=Caerostris extrusa TaxID=172846 RepID=A0AAV4XGE5_CAEEX|nr:hypothetical protein CEXT_517041 [Caerostris extrusa]
MPYVYATNYLPPKPIFSNGILKSPTFLFQTFLFSSKSKKKEKHSKRIEKNKKEKNVPVFTHIENFFYRWRVTFEEWVPPTSQLLIYCKNLGTKDSGLGRV